MDCTNIQQLIRRFRRERAETVYRVSEGTADHTEDQRALKEEVDQLISECKQNGSRYTDDEFPNAANENDDVLEKIKQWRRIGDTSPRGANKRKTWSLFDKPQPSDVAQGNLGDCWLVSGISLISNKPHILQRIFVTKKYNKQGVYGLQLFVDGEWKRVIVDDRFPCNEDGELIFAWAEKMQLWAPLLEKAVAKLFGSYSALDAGGEYSVGYTLLTGAAVEGIYSDTSLLLTSNQEESQAKIFDQVRYALEDNLLLSTDSIDDAAVLAPVGLEKSHIYSILDATILEGTYRLLLLRNIWGVGTYRGRWGPDTDHWRAIRDRDTLPKTFGDKSKGTFWILIEDLAQYFYSIMICYARENYYEYHLRAALPRGGSDEWETFEVEVTEETRLDMSFGQIEGVVAAYINPITTSAFIFDDNDNLIGSTGQNGMQITLWKSRLLAPGTYRIYIFAFTRWNATSPIEYNFEVHSSREVNCRKISKPTVQFRIFIAKMVLRLGTQFQSGVVTFYNLQDREVWPGAIVVASNNGLFEEIGCSVVRINYQNILSTRTLGDTYDVIPPANSQILQILSLDESKSGSGCIEFDGVAEPVSQRVGFKPNHSPPLINDNSKIHRIFLTERMR